MWNCSVCITFWLCRVVGFVYIVVVVGAVVVIVAISISGSHTVLFKFYQDRWNGIWSLIIKMHSGGDSICQPVRVKDHFLFLWPAYVLICTSAFSFALSLVLSLTPHFPYAYMCLCYLLKVNFIMCDMWVTMYSLCFVRTKQV